MGYYSYQNGLIFRHLNQSGGWASHLEHCRNFILRAIDFHKPEKITVLGSGWLLELPLAEMSEKVNLICLEDIVHPPEVIEQVKDLKYVKLDETDISGGLINEVWQKTRNHNFFNKLKSLNEIIIPEYEPGSDPGMVISLNILTQLESLLIEHLKKKSAVSEEEYTKFRTEIQKRHIDFLKKHRSVLISDYSEVTTKNNGAFSIVPTLMTELPSPCFKEEWTWDFDQAGSDFFNSTSLMKVVALTF